MKKPLQRYQKTEPVPLVWRAGRYDEQATVHDHFDGSANCIECKGWCKLHGTEMAYTALVRWLFKGEAPGLLMQISVERQLKSSGVDVVKFRARVEANR